MLFAELQTWLKELGRLDDVTADYVGELARFSWMRKADLTDYDAVMEGAFHFDMKAQERGNFSMPADSTRLGAVQKLRVAHTPSQKEQLSAYAKEFGNSHDGLGKMLMRYPHVHRMFRRAEAA